MRILLIDDSISVLSYLEKIFNRIEYCEIFIQNNPREALFDIQKINPDLAIVDYEMPELNGIRVVEALRGQNETANIPVIMLTSVTDKAIRIEAITAGVTDFLNKPFDDTELLLRVRNFLSLRQAQLSLRKKAEELQLQINEAMLRIHRREEEIIWRLAKAIDCRDRDTGGHLDRVAIVAKAIAEELGLDRQQCRMIFLASPLHDVGKLAVKDAILLKPGRLESDEIVEMRRHTEFGADILHGSHSKLIQIGEVIAASHHEKWDGSGYPKGLKGEEIPIEARIVAVADVLDALCSSRPYKAAWNVNDAFKEIINTSGKHFDPSCVAALCRRWKSIRPMFAEPIQVDVMQSVSPAYGVGS